MLCPGRAYDRSPCGTGTSAKIACLFSDGKLAEGAVWRQESIIGSVFEAWAVKSERGVRPQIRGSAYVNAESTLDRRSRRPLRAGYPAMSTSNAARRAVVIGGGVIGVSCAHYLLRDGWQVTLVDRKTVGSGSSHGNCGLICPSHILPLAEPGMVQKGIKSLFRQELALRDQAAVRPCPLVVALALRRPLQRARHDRSRTRNPVPAQLVTAAVSRADRARSLDCEFELRGLLFAFRSQHEMDAYAATDRLMTEAFACPAKRLSAR